MDSQKRDVGSGVKSRSCRVAFAAHLLASTAFVGLCPYVLKPMPAVAQTGDVRAFHIPAQPLSSALNAFGRQSGLQITTASSTANGVMSRAVDGNYTPRQALTILLEGTGISFRIGADRTVFIGQPQTGDAVAVDADGSLMLETIDVSGQGGKIGADFDPQEIYKTPDAVYNVDRETLDRVPVTSPGDILKGVPGVTVTDNRNSGGFSPNIRGAQGMGRVKVVVDGSEGSVSANRGYGGNSEANFIDPDLIAGYSVEKGPSSETGAIGGAMKVRTMEAKDIIKDGRDWGVRVRGMIGDNASDGHDGIGQCISPGSTSCTSNPANSVAGPERFAAASDHNYSGSAIAAWRSNDMFEFVGGVVRRRSGNYTSGKNGDMAGLDYFNGPGKEIFGSFKNSESLMLKGAFTPSDEHRLSFGFNRYYSEYADRRTAGIGDSSLDIRFPLPSDVVQKRFTLSYAWTPADNPWFNLKADAWSVNTEEERVGNFQQNVDGTNNGARIANRSEIDLPWFTALLDVGGQYRREHMNWLDRAFIRQGSDGLTKDEQDLYGIYANLELPVLDWLTLHGGARHDWSRTERVKSRSNLPPTVGALIHDTNVDGATFNGGIVLKPLDPVQIYAKYSQGWRAPSLLESLPLSGATGVPWGTSPNSMPPRPEQSENYEVGFNYSDTGVLSEDDRLGVKVSYFDNKYEDYLSGGQSYPGIRNADSARFRGLETSFSYDVGWAYAQYGWTHYFESQVCGIVQLTVQPGGPCRDLTPTDGLQIIGFYTPPTNKHDLTVGARFFDRKLDIGTTMTYVEGAQGYDGIRYTTHNYTIFDAFLRYDFEDDLKLNISVENLTDEFYYDAGTQNFASIPAPGRTVRFMLTKGF